MRINILSLFIACSFFWGCDNEVAGQRPAFFEETLRSAPPQVSRDYVPVHISSEFRLILSNFSLTPLPTSRITGTHEDISTIGTDAGIVASGSPAGPSVNVSPDGKASFQAVPQIASLVHVAAGYLSKIFLAYDESKLSPSSDVSCSFIDLAGISCLLSSLSISTSDVPASTEGLSMQLAADSNPGLIIEPSNEIAIKTIQTKLISNVSGGLETSDKIGAVIAIDGKLYFSGVNEQDVTKLYVLENDTVRQVSNTSGDAALPDDPLYFSEFGNLLYFSSKNTNGRSKLYKTDGQKVFQLSNTRGNQDLSDDPRPQLPVTSSIENRGTVMNGFLYFRSGSPLGVNKLYKTDGNNISLVGHTRGEASADNPNDLMVFRDWLYFGASYQSGSSRRLFRTDGSAIEMISATSGASSDLPQRRAHGRDSMYFDALDSGGFHKLYKVEGTSMTQISNTNPGGNDAPACIFELPDQTVVFRSNNSQGVQKLHTWKNGVQRQLSNISGSDAISDEITLACTTSGFPFYFVASKSPGISKLYSTDGETISMVADTRQNPDLSDQVSGLLPNEKRLFFRAMDALGDGAIFMLQDERLYQLTSASQGIFVDLGNTCGGFRYLTIDADSLYFVASLTDPASSCRLKLFRSDLPPL